MTDTLVAERPKAETSATQVLDAWLQHFDDALARGDVEAASGLFAPTCFWRDLVAFTWNIKTMEGRDDVAAMLRACLGGVKPHGWERDGQASEQNGIVEGWITFETAVARGRGHVRLRDGVCWTLLTTMAELKGHEEKRGSTRAMGAEHGAQRNRRSWRETRELDAAELGITRQPFCLIVGGGQGGLALGARLKRLDVPTLIIDKHELPGDSWRNRYKSLCLHDPVWYDHLPYLPFPDHWPVFAPKDKIGDWLEMYAKVMELDIWNSTACEGARYDEAARTWVVEVLRDGKPVTLRPSQLVLATGMSGIPNVPQYPGAHTFEGRQHHSSQHPGGQAFADRRCVVIGSNNSSHDICADLWENGADVTMVQRTSTHIARSETLMELSLGALYSEKALAAGMTTEKADMTFASVPYRIMHEFQMPVYAEMKKRDAAFYDRLEAAGFLLDFGDDESGLFMKYLRRGSGYYIDVGASDLLADGKIKLKSGVDVREIKPHAVVLSDGAELPADLIVYATGYGSMNGWAGKLISKEVADRVGKCWGLGSDTSKDPGPWEGELRNMWKPTQQEALWFHGGNLHQSRHYSTYLALQLKARQAGLATPVYGMGEVHHTA